MSGGAGKDAGGADQARRLTSSTETDWGGRSHGTLILLMFLGISDRYSLSHRRQLWAVAILALLPPVPLDRPLYRQVRRQSYRARAPERRVNV